MGKETFRAKLSKSGPVLYVALPKPYHNEFSPGKYYEVSIKEV